VVRRATPPVVIGMITRSDVLNAFQHRIRDRTPQKPTISMRMPRRKRSSPKSQ
jgi:hypothetical protein